MGTIIGFEKLIFKDSETDETIMIIDIDKDEFFQEITLDKKKIK